MRTLILWRMLWNALKILKSMRQMIIGLSARRRKTENGTQIRFIGIAVLVRITMT